MGNQKGNYQLLIEKLDHFIRKYYLNQIIRGFLYSVGFVLLFFLVINVLEHFFYFDKGLRKILFFSFLIASFGAFSLWVLSPLLHYFRLGKTISHDRAAEIVGNHFDDVKDKLLNILQLERQSHNIDNRALILASIDQKAESIKIVPFKKAIDLNKNRKYLKYSLPPLLILLILLIAAPSVITNSTHRLVHNNKEFEKEAPFSFILNNEELRAVQYDDFTLDINIEGNILPNEAFIKIEDYVYRLQKNNKDNYSYTFNNVQKKTPFTLFSGDVETKDFELSIIKKPVIIDFNLALDYPAYTKRRDESLENIGDIIVPLGTKVNWQFNTQNTEKVEIRLQGKTVESLERKSSYLFDYSSRVYKPGYYKLFVSNSELPNADSVQYSIQIIPDQYPSIDVEVFEDSINTNLVYFIGNVSDDYGLKSVTFNYRKGKSGNQDQLKSIPVLEPKNRNAQYQYTWDKTLLDLKAGEQISYFFEVFDNDGINGSKSSKTQIFEINKPSVKEYEKSAEDNNRDIKEELKKSLLESQKLKEDIKKLKEKLLQKKEIGWEEKKEIEKLLDRQKELEKMIEKAKEKFKENKKNQEEFSKPNEDLLEKQEKMEEMFEDLMSEEMKSLMEEIQNLLQELQKDEALEMMQEFEFNDQEMEMDLDRMLELFKQLEVEQEMQQQVDKLEELAEKQEELSEQTENEEKPQEELQQEQEDINEEFEDIKEKLDDIEKKNEEMERPKNLEDSEAKEEEISKELEKSADQLEQKENKKASESQKNAAEKMKEMAESMSQQMQSAEMEQMQEDMKALRQLLENLVGLSFDQEDLVKKLSGSRINTPRYISLVQEQHKLKSDFQLIQDSLLALSKRVMEIESFVTEKIASVNENMEVGLKRLEERQKSQSSDNQQRIMTNVNDLALMLNEAMEQMQQQMSGMMSGSQMCDNPGNSSGQTPSDKMTKAGEQMGKQMKGMQDAMDQQGEGKERLSSEQFAKMAAKQAALRKLLKEIAEEKSEKGQGSKELEDLQKGLNKIEIDLVNKQLTNEMLKRQQEIQTRLLEAEKAERQRGEEEKRKAQVGTDKTRELPPSLKEYLKKREAEVDDFKLISPDVKPYYKQLIDEYVKSLKNNK